MHCLCVWRLKPINLHLIHTVELEWSTKSGKNVKKNPFFYILRPVTGLLKVNIRLFFIRFFQTQFFLTIFLFFEPCAFSLLLALPMQSAYICTQQCRIILALIRFNFSPIYIYMHVFVRMKLQKSEWTKNTIHPLNWLSEWASEQA